MFILMKNIPHFRYDANCNINQIDVFLMFQQLLELDH